MKKRIKRIGAVFLAMALCLTAMGNNAFTISAHAEETQAGGASDSGDSDTTDTNTNNTSTGDTSSVETSNGETIVTPESGSVTDTTTTDAADDTAATDPAGDTNTTATDDTTATNPAGDTNTTAADDTAATNPADDTNTTATDDTAATNPAGDIPTTDTTVTTEEMITATQETLLTVNDLEDVTAVAAYADALATESLGVGIQAAEITGIDGFKKVNDADGNAVTDADGRQLYETSVPGIRCYLDTDFAKDSNLDYTFDKRGCITGVTVHFVISADVDGDQMLPISEAVLAAMNLYAVDPGNGMASYPQLPGDAIQFKFEITAADGMKHTYQYKDGSFSLTTPDQPEGEVTDATGFDGNKLAYDYVGALAKSTPIQKLLGVNSGSRITIDKILTLYDRLEEKGFTGENALTDYMLSYYNNLYGSHYASFEELTNEKPSAVVNMQGGLANAQYDLNAAKLAQLKETYAEEFAKGYIKEIQNSNGTYTLQLKWPETALQSASYDLFYKDLFLFTYGTEYTYKEFSTHLNGENGMDLGIGDYMALDSKLWEQANNYFNSLSKLGFTTDAAGSIAFQMMLGLNGPGTNNAYQLYNYSFKNGITLEQVDGGISVDKVDTDGNKITSGEAGFNLYYVTVENKNNVTYYYKADGTFTTNKNEAAVLMTVDGNLNVQYLLPNTYYLSEVLAPDGYTINADVLEILVEKGTITAATFTDAAIGKPGPDPTPDPGPTTEETTDGGSGGGGTGTIVTPVETPVPAVLGAARAIPDEDTPLADTVPVSEPGVLGARRGVQTSDDSYMAAVVCFVLSAGCFLFTRKKERFE
ncbi:MAG: prealbumin-like fold domain-containing protein [Lachnospiraceae bacterium]|nr:prealbumin-like fold domain-containing protein [Lachnospiraceae bacterium]